MSQWMVVETKGVVRLAERPAKPRRKRKIRPARLIRLTIAAARKIRAKACSSTWAQDCLIRGAVYAPDFRCRCETCRELFPQRRYPRSNRESDYAEDCQVETDTDPELEEELAKLRNRRERIGSVFLMTDATHPLGR